MAGWANRGLPGRLQLWRRRLRPSRFSCTALRLPYVRTRLFAIVAGLVVVMLLAAGAVYAYDSSRSDRIAKGITVSHVDVGGMSWAAARAKLERELLSPLRRPVVVRYKKRRFRLTPAQAKVAIDLDGSVDRALARSREGDPVSRTVRALSGGGRVEADVPVDIDHDAAASRRLAARIGRALYKPPKEAEVSFAGGRIDRTPSRTGRRVRTTTLRREIDAKLRSLDGSRTVRVRTETVQPEVTTENVAERYPAVLVVDRASFRLTLYKNLELAQTYGIAVGQVGLDTPAGLYRIQNKAVDPAWHVPNSDWAGELAGKVIPGGVPENPIKARWLGVYDGVGIHGTADEGSIGSNASHGCIRMRVADVTRLYDEVPVGAPIYIA